MISTGTQITKRNYPGAFMTRFNSFADARKSLKDNGFKETQWSEERQKFVSTDTPAAYLDDYARIAVFLCHRKYFISALDAVSTQLWIAYSGLPPEMKNKFTRALSIVAAKYGFTFQNRIPMDTAHGAPIGIKLVAGDLGLGWMLRNKLFWKDSMEGRHGEHTHSLQWLAIAHHRSTIAPAAELYSKASTYRTTTKDLKDAYLWQWLADCFPVDKKAAGDATVFANGETLLSDSFRSPQNIMDQLLLGDSGKRAGHFVANYLFRRYNKRKWLELDAHGKVRSLKGADIRGHGEQNAETKLEAINRGANVDTSHEWVRSPASPDARLLRNKDYIMPKNVEKLIAPIGESVSFHGIKGRLYMD